MILFTVANRKVLLSPDTTSGDLARHLQAMEPAKSPFLKTLVFDTERPSALRYRTPDDDSTKEPALVGVLAAARLALQLQQFGADGSILNFDGALSAEAIKRTKFLLFINH